MKTVLISYNAFNCDPCRGWSGNVLLLQEVRYEDFGNPNEDWGRVGAENWAELGKLLEAPDEARFVIYVGVHQAEDVRQVLESLSSLGLTPQRTTFVCCGCAIRFKKDMIHSLGFGASKIIISNCGGDGVMRCLYEEAMNDIAQSSASPSA